MRDSPSDGAWILVTSEVMLAYVPCLLQMIFSFDDGSPAKQKSSAACNKCKDGAYQ